MAAPTPSNQAKVSSYKHHGQQSRRAVIVIAISVLVALMWKFVDANATLWIFDRMLSVTTTTKTRFRKFEGKTIWITGASSGIGAELVCLLTEAEAGHIILSSRREKKLKQVANSCKDRASQDSTFVSTKFSVIPFDAFEPDIDDVVSTALALAGSVDILILNAGIYQLKPALETDMEAVQRIMKIDFETPVALSTALLKTDKWKERGHGHILVVSSLIGRGANSLTSAYAAAKHALRGYFHSLSTEEHSWLRVDVAAPGAVDTALWTTGFDKTVACSQSIKLATDRCARLILTGMAGPHFLFYETWIAKPLGLLWVYLSLIPNVFHWSVHLLGTLRVAAYKEDGSDALDIPTLLGQMLK